MTDRKPDTFNLPQKLLLLAIIAISAYAIYSNTFSVPFVFDDHELIEENLLIRNLGNFTDFSGTRYLALLSYAINYALGGLDVRGYHVVNIGIHALNAFLAFMLVDLAYRTKVNSRALSGIWPALLASFLFLAHPVQTQAVTYLAQRIASLAAFFYLLAIVTYFKARLEDAGPILQQGQAAIRSGLTRKGAVCYAISLLCAIAAQKTKEISFTLPFVIVLVEFVFFAGRFDSAQTAIFAAKRSARYFVPFLLTLVIIPATIYSSKQVAVPEASVSAQTAAASSQAVSIERRNKADFGELMKEELADISRHDYLATQMRVVVTYLRLLVWPAGQNLDYDYPVFRTFLVPQVYLSFVFLLLLFSFGAYVLVRSQRAGNINGVLVGFGIIFFFTALSIESSIIPISDVIFEHRLYLPSIGAFVAFAAAFKWLLDSRRALITAATVLLVVAVAGLGAASYARNRVWVDELTLMLDVVKKSPEKARAYNNVALGLAAKGRESEAIPYLEKVVSLEPGFFGAYNNMGNALIKAGRIAEAIGYFRKAIELKPEYWKANYNMGLALARLGRYDESIPYLQRAVVAQPRDADLYNNLANAMLLAGRVDEAVRNYEMALYIDPNHANARINLENARKRLRKRR